MAFDPHEIRMAAGNGAMKYIDIWDDEAIALVEPVVESVQALARCFQVKGVSMRDTATILNGMVLALVMPGDGDANE